MKIVAAAFAASVMAGCVSAPVVDCNYKSQPCKAKSCKAAENADAEGFVTIFNGKDLTGWMGATKTYGVDPKEPGVLQCFPNRGGEGGGGNLCTEKTYRNFVLRFEFCLPTNGNNGLGFGGGNQNTGAGFTMVMDAIQRNGVDISQLASTLNCSIGQVQNAIQQVATQICNVGNQVGMTGQQIINAVQQGNMALTQQICNCCCDLKSLIAGQTNTLQRDINDVQQTVSRAAADLGYATRDQTCAIEKAIGASTEATLAALRAAEMREMQREISERDRRIGEQSVVINNFQQSQAFGQMLGQALAPVNAAVAGLVKEVGEIQCRLPETKVISCPDNYVRVNTDVTSPYRVVPACQGGYGTFCQGGYGWPFGFWPNGNNGGWG